MGDDPSLRELKALIERNHADAREDYIDLKAQFGRDMANVLTQMQNFVLREVFDARESALLQRIATQDQRIAALEESAKTQRTQVRGAVMAAAGSVVAAILTAVILSVVLKGGKP